MARKVFPIRATLFFFTGETWQGTKVRVFAYRAAPSQFKKAPGILHIHEGGQTASLEWVRYWANRGYVCVSHDFCGKMKGREPEAVTQWGTAPGDMAEAAGSLSTFRPSPRFNAWYHWILVARRALTLLEQHPQVDPKRIGVFGISVGGMLTWMVAGATIESPPLRQFMVRDKTLTPFLGSPLTTQSMKIHV